MIHDGHIALWNRLLYVKFLGKFVQNTNPAIPVECNDNVMDVWSRDHAYLHAFLHFCVIGAVRYYKEGLSPISKDYINVKAEIIEVFDCYRMFIDERCILYPNDKNHWIVSNDLYNNFKTRFMRKMGDGCRPHVQTYFNEKILALCHHTGVDKVKCSFYRFYYIELKPPEGSNITNVCYYKLYK